MLEKKISFLQLGALLQLSDYVLQIIVYRHPLQVCFFLCKVKKVSLHCEGAASSVESRGTKAVASRALTLLNELKQASKFSSSLPH